MKYKAVIYHPFNEKNLGFTKERFSTLLKKFQDISFHYPHNEDSFYKEVIDADFIIALKISSDLYIRAKRLKAVFTCMAGRDAIPENSNIKKYYGYFHGKLIRETLLSAMLVFNQRLLALINCQNNMRWANAKEYGNRTQIENQSIAIIGYGAIGEYCAKYLSNLGMKNIFAIQRSKREGHCNKTNANYIHISDMNKIIPLVDHVVSFLPQSEETNSMFDSDFFKNMNSKAYFYNFGRGNAVVENDLSTALNQNEIQGAYLDVFQHEPLQKESSLWKSKNLIITPHISTYYSNYFNEYGNELISQLEEALCFLSNQ